MPLQNRVTPLGEFRATPERGTLFGNRGGRLHDPATRGLGRRRWAGKAWISCVLEWRGVRRSVWGESFTELFFLDEVTALAAGHRPCALCRRAAAQAFLAAIGRATDGAAEAPGRLPALDARLHAERLEGRAQRHHRGTGETLPDGAVIVLDGEPHARHSGRRLAWSAQGWREAGPFPSGEVEIITPPTALLALAGGYRPLWHSSAMPAGQPH